MGALARGGDAEVIKLELASIAFLDYLATISEEDQGFLVITVEPDVQKGDAVLETKWTSVGEVLVSDKVGQLRERVISGKAGRNSERRSFCEREYQRTDSNTNSGLTYP